MKNGFAPWQRAALAPPHDVEIAAELDLACMRLLAKGRGVMLTCDSAIEIARTFGGPV